MNCYYYFPEGSQAKLHINLPFLTWELISNDMHDFADTMHSEGYSSFVNRIVINYISSGRYPAHLNDMLESLGKETREYAINEIKKEFDLPKEMGRKVDLNKKCLQELESISLIIDNQKPLVAQVFDTTGLFIRAILIDYSKQRYDTRYLIYRNDLSSAIADAIKDRYSINVTFTDNTTSEVIPYGIESDSYRVHTYLVGLSPKTRSLKDITLRKLSSIKRVTFGKSNTCLTKEETSAIREVIKVNGVSFVRAQTSDFVVYLTHNGEKLYKDMAINRPRHLPQSPEEKEKHLYRFVCTKFQIKTYFRRFGADAVIVSPEKVRQEMLEEYREALRAYEEIHLEN
ncbi:MAG: WYL domain-containing protein [Veillonella sp.]|nr:WYL domain-containing protein [Veillonella sp.]